MTTHPFVDTPATLETFVAAWHAGGVSRAEWTHGAHVAVCAYYAFEREPDATFAIVKAGILAFARASGIVHTATSGYHETLTRFWTLVIAAHVRERGAASRWEAARAALDRFGDDRDLPQRAYSFDVVRDVRARAEWVAPDRDVDGLPAVA
ncbi:MAG: hypothetical protein ABIT71_14955 [Vicinamibacteraceae bacterium]